MLCVEHKICFKTVFYGPVLNLRHFFFKFRKDHKKKLEKSDVSKIIFKELKQFTYSMYRTVFIEIKVPCPFLLFYFFFYCEKSNIQ